MDRYDKQLQRSARVSDVGYKQLLSERAFLRVAERARKLSGTNLVSISFKDNRLMFKTLSGTDKKTLWTQIVEIQDIDANVVQSLGFHQLVDVIRHAKLKVFCNCPAFLFWGFQYLSWRKGYGLVKETRRPKVRNPHQKGNVCKHLFQVMQVYPFLATTLAKKFKSALK